MGGLPDWRMPAFYDRQVQVVRHIGLLEGLITLLVLASFIQYGMGWANYLEQKFLAPKPKVKKEKKVKKSEVAKEESKEVVVDEFEHLKPSVYNPLPFQLYKLCKQAPELVEYAKGAWEERQTRKKEEAAAEEEAQAHKEKQEARRAGRKRLLLRAIKEPIFIWGT